MSVETPLPPPPPSSLTPPRSPISAAERARREREVEFARENVRHEGSSLPDEIEFLDARYFAGGFGRHELTVAVLAPKVVQIQ